MRAHKFGWRRLRRPRRIHDPSVPTPARMLGLLALLSLCSKVPAFIQAAGLGIALGYAGAMAVSRKGCNGYSTNGDDRPVLDVLDTAIEAPSVANLDRDLTINGTTVSPTFFYKMEDTASGNLVAEVGSDVPVVAGGGLAYDEGCPLMGTDTAITGDGTGRFQFGSNTYGDITTGDFILEGIIKKQNGASDCVVCKRNGVNEGWEFRNDGAGTGWYLPIETTGTARGPVSAALTSGAWYHVFVTMDRSGSGQIYIDGVASGAAVNIEPNNATITTANPLTIMANVAGAQQWTSSIAQLALWVGTATWFHATGATAEAANALIAAQRFRALTGFRPQVSDAGRDTAPVTFARNSNATLEKYNETTGAVELYTVGPHWMRVERWLDDSGNVVMGYRSELAGENKCIQSEDIATTWTPLDAGDTITATTIAADATDGDHGVTQDITLTAASWVLWGEATKGNKDWVYASDDTVANATGYFDIDTPAAGTFGAGATGGVIDRGDRTLWWMTFTGTAAAHTVKVQSAHADGDKDFAGDGSAVNTTFHRIQCELGTYPSSYVATAAAAATRVKDEVELDITGAGVGAQGAIVMDVVCRDSDVLPGKASYLAHISNGADLDTQTRMNITAAGDVMEALANTDGKVSGTTDIASGSVIRAGATWKEGLLELWVNGAGEGTPDATVTAPGAQTQLAIGQLFGNSGQPSIPALIRRIRIYRRFQHGMAALTSGVN